MKVLAAAALLFVSCNTAPVQKPIDIALSTEGGFTGRGVGGVTIRDTRVSGTTLGTATCDGELTPDEARELSAAIANTAPSTWKRDYTPASNPSGYADQVRYTLSVSGTTTSWTDEARDRLPEDLAALHEIVWRIRARVCK